MNLALKLNWNFIEIKDIGIEIVDGDRGKNYPKKEEFTDKGFCAFISTSNIKDDRFDLSKCDFISSQKDLKLGKGKLQLFDIVLTTRGTVGSVAYFHRNIHLDCVRINSGMVIIRCNNNCDSSYIYQLLKSPYLKSQYLLYSSGSAQPQLPIKDLKRISIPIPPLSIQKKIAAVLSAYDDLIENNDRRIALLEKMAEEIYREWFVRLRFPGFDRATFHKGIPEGWEIKDLKDAGISILDGDRGSNYPSKDEFSESGYCLFLNTGNIKDDKFDFSKNDFITEQKDSILRKGKLVFNDIILTTRGTVGSIAFYSKNLMYQNVRINSGMVILRPENGEDEALYYYYLLKSSLLKDQYRSYSSGSAQPQLPIKDLRRINILIPPAEITKQFCNLAGIFVDQLDLLQLANWNLKQTRDRLLTRLISGKLSVEDLDIQFPLSMTTDP
jgi:type I restriction enzyme, S subunit